MPHVGFPRGPQENDPEQGRLSGTGLRAQAQTIQWLGADVNFSALILPERHCGGFQQGIVQGHRPLLLRGQQLFCHRRESAREVLVLGSLH